MVMTSTIKIRRTSRLQFARILSIATVECWEMPEYPEIEEANDDTIYTVKQVDRIDALAQRFYGAADLWYIIALANDMRLLPSDLKPFTTIRIPSSRRVFSTILRTAVKRREGR